MLDGILGKLCGFQKGRVVEAIGAGVDQSRSANFLLWTQKARNRGRSKRRPATEQVLIL